LKLFLGTAQWGWNVTRDEAFGILDEFTNAGHWEVDTATNYPINGEPGKSGTAIRWIAEWVRERSSSNLNVNVKIGSTSNNFTGPNCLEVDFLKNEVDWIALALGKSLKTITIHWDDRESLVEVAQTAAFLQGLHQRGYQVGLSGIRRPDLYRLSCPELSSHWWIQVRENAIETTERLRYQSWFPEANYMAYGINFGGFSPESHEGQRSTFALRQKQMSPQMRLRLIEAFRSASWQSTPMKEQALSFYEFALSELALRPLAAIIVGPRTRLQWRQILQMWSSLTRDPI
jgi:aryl-alcohol dehydrogenase-like predicted oxidoreductase